MQRVDASRIIRQVWSRWSGDAYESIPVEDMDNIRLWFAVRFREAFHYQLWPVNKRVELRYFRECWSRYGPMLDENKRPILDGSGEYIWLDKVWQAGDEVYYPPTSKYYRSLQSGHQVAPADSAGTINAAYWAELEGSYTVEDWAADTAYAAGDQVRNPETNYPYACIEAHTSGTQFDYGKWYWLDEFRRYVAPDQFGETEIGTMLRGWTNDPRRDKSGTEVALEHTSEGYTTTLEIDSIWLEFIAACPRLDLDDYETASSYSAGQRVYFTTSTGAGNWYTCLIAAPAGYTPESHPSYWSLIEIPDFFEAFLIWSILSDAYRSDQKWEISDSAEERAYGYLDDEAFRLVGQEKQTNPVSIYSR